MELEIKQVGRRWFRVFTNKGEAEASYSISYWDRKRVWTIAGSGSRKYRHEIIEAIEKLVDF